PQLDNKDLEEINQDDLEEMGLKWQLVLTKPRLGVLTVIEEGTLPGIAEQPGIQETRPAREEDEKALVVQDGLGTYDWSYQLEEETIDFALMVFTSNPSSSSSSNSM
nr:hypothetical protein [Tanacetum cinerariifolium]